MYMQMAEIDVDDKPQLILEDSDDGDDGHCAAHEDADSGQEVQAVERRSPFRVPASHGYL